MNNIKYFIIINLKLYLSIMFRVLIPIVSILRFKLNFKILHFHLYDYCSNVFLSINMLYKKISKLYSDNWPKYLQSNNYITTHLAIFKTTVNILSPSKIMSPPVNYIEHVIIIYKMVFIYRSLDNLQ